MIEGETNCKSSSTSAPKSSSSASISSEPSSLSVLGSASKSTWSSAESTLLGSSSLGFWSSGSWGFALLGESFDLQEVFGIYVEDLVRLEWWWINSFSWFNAEIEVTDGAKNLIDSTDFGLVFEVDSSVEFGKSRHISALDNELVFASVLVCSIRNDKSRWSLVNLSEVTSSTSAPSPSTSLTTSLPESSSWVIALILFTHDLIYV